MSAIDLRLGRWEDVLSDVECDALIFDPPYGARCHSGHDAGVSMTEATGFVGGQRNALSYAAWTPDDVHACVSSWSPRTRGWICAMTSHDLVPAWESAFADAGRYHFAPLPCVVSGMTVRMVGDGPSSWCVWLMVARPKTKEYATWGTLPGAYVGKRGSDQHIGGKPQWLMNGIVRDYSKPGDLVCDPCAGYGTTLQAAESLGRRAIGAEVDPETHAAAMQRLGQCQYDLFAGGWL